MFAVKIVFAAISAVVILPATILLAFTVLFAIALAVPVKLPVTFPSKSATSVPFAYPVPEVFTVVVGCTCKS